MLTFYFSNADSVMKESAVLTSGMMGKEVKLEFSEDWDGLSKTVVFSNGSVTLDVVCTGETVVIPAKILEKPLRRLTVGVYGVSSDGKLAIPTVRAEGPVIRPGVDPTGDPALDPELPIWAQIQGIIGDIRELRTGDTSSLVAAINEVLAKASEDCELTDEICAEIETVLQEAKERGEFDGPAGADGADGVSPAITMTRSDDVDGSGRSGLAVNVETLTADGMTVSMNYLYDGEGIDSVTVVTLEPGEDATAALINSIGNSRTLKLGIPRGKSAYEYAREGGFTGTEEEFAGKLAALGLADA